MPADPLAIEAGLKSLREHIPSLQNIASQVLQLISQATLHGTGSISTIALEKIHSDLMDLQARKSSDSKAFDQVIHALDAERTRHNITKKSLAEQEVINLGLQQQLSDTEGILLLQQSQIHEFEGRTG